MIHQTRSETRDRDAHTRFGSQQPLAFGSCLCVCVSGINQLVEFLGQQPLVLRSIGSCLHLKNALTLRSIRTHTQTRAYKHTHLAHIHLCTYTFRSETHIHSRTHSLIRTFRDVEAPNQYNQQRPNRTPLDDGLCQLCSTVVLSGRLYIKSGETL